MISFTKYFSEENESWESKLSSVKKREIFFSSNQFSVKFFTNKLIWRKICEKTVAVKFRNFHTVLSYVCGNFKIFVT